MFLRNKDGYFVNTNMFSDAANHFEKYGRFTDYKDGSSGWYDFWKEELDKRINGITIGGLSISGDHYNYLNYSRIKKIPDNIPIGTKSIRKIIGFPNFIDGDYDFFWNCAISEFGCTEEFLNNLFLENIPKYNCGGKNMLVAKSRRKGYTYKISAMSTNRYDTIPNGIILQCAYDNKYLFGRNGIFDMSRRNADFLNKYTAWLKLRQKSDAKNTMKASFLEYDPVTKLHVEAGFLSQIIAVSFHDDPDAARGVDFDFAAVDEAGVFPNWKKSYTVISPSQEAGEYRTGFMIIFGTGGDMDGGTLDFAEQFYEADLYGFNVYENKWDKGKVKPGGYFHPDYIGKEGFIDKDGNSDREGAKKHRDDIISNLMKEGKNEDARLYMTEHANSPSEAFLRSSNTKYPTSIIKHHLDRVIADKLYEKTGTPVEFYYESGEYKYKVVTDGSKTPFNEYPVTHFEPGCPVMFIPPSKVKKPNMSFSGYDPVNQDHSDHSNSIAGFVIYTPDVGFGSGICLTYWGRPGTAEFNDNIIAALSIYGLDCMHENMTTQVYTHFEKRKKLHLLAEKPDYFLKKVLKSSSSARPKGCHMNSIIRGDAEKYDLDWLMTPRGLDPETGAEILNLHTITDIGLLKEYMVYDGILNTDRVDAMLLARIHAAEREHIVEDSSHDNDDDDAWKQVEQYLSNNHNV